MVASKENSSLRWEFFLFSEIAEADDFG
jgi:hypothetical protein